MFRFCNHFPLGANIIKNKSHRNYSLSREKLSFLLIEMEFIFIFFYNLENINSAKYAFKKIFLVIEKNLIKIVNSVVKFKGNFPF